ncbi:MAG: hypothetical protein AAFN79_07345 [Pseudomonadota bacterium]
MTLSASSFTATGFVSALAVVGAVSHLGVSAPVSGDVMTGSLQSLYEERFFDANPLKDIAVGALASIRYAALGEAYQGAIVGRDGWLFTAEELEVHPNFAANIEASARRVAAVRDELAARGARLIVVAVPDKAEIYEDRLGRARPSPVGNRLSAFASHLDRMGVERVGAAAALRGDMAYGEVFMRDDTHWSPRGAEAVAMATALRLADADYARTGVETRRLEDAAFDGDLLAFVPTGPFRDVVGPPRRSIQRYETVVEAAGGLFGDAPVEIALVGTSFSAKPDFHFEGFLKQALGADILNFAREGAGPFAPMDAFLLSEELNTTPPKVVIWEVPVRYVSKEMN